MVVQDLPAVSAALQQQRKRTARRHRVAPQQLEARGRQSKVERQRSHVQLLEGERVTVLPRREVVRQVAIMERLPAVLHVAAAHVAGEGVVEVVAHEAFEVAAVPIRGRAAQHRADFRLRVARSHVGRRARRQTDDRHAPRTAHPAPLLSASGPNVASSMAAATPRADSGYLWETIVTGPVRSRRLGMSLGLNLLPSRSKICSFDCPYCECGFNTPQAPGARWPSPDEVAHSLRRALDRLPAPPQWITFRGNGEPTLHPRFAVAGERGLEVRAERAPDVVHLYSLDRAPADARVQNVPRERLLEMALAIRQTLPRIVVEVF